MKNWKYFLHHFFKRKYTFSLSKEKLEEKLPLWALPNINKELNFSKKAIKETYEQTTKNVKDSWLYHLKIEKNTFISLSPQNSDHPRFLKFKFFMEKILPYFNWPDVEFLYSILDHYETSELLKYVYAPVLIISKTAKNSKTLLFPHVEWAGYNENLIKKIEKTSNRIPWEQRREKLFWRGNSSGLMRRLPIVELSEKNPQLIDAAFCDFCQLDTKTEQFLRKKFPPKKWLAPEKQLKYKYLAAIDGNCFPGSFFWQLFSKSLIFKQESEFLEWFYPALLPNVHFISFKENLLEKIDAMKNDDIKANEIALNAYFFAKKNLSNEFMALYIYHLLKEIACRQ